MIFQPLAWVILLYLLILCILTTSARILLNFVWCLVAPTIEGQGYPSRRTLGVLTKSVLLMMGDSIWHNRFAKSYIYDSPDGEDCLKKTFHSAKLGAIVGKI